MIRERGVPRFALFRSIQFKAVYADDGKLDDSGNTIVPGARDIAEVLVARLRSRVDSISDIEQHSDYGWGFHVRFCGRHFYNVLNPIDEECWLTVEFPLQFLWALLLRRPRETFDKYCDVMSDTLAKIPDVSALQWQDYFH